MPGVKVLILAPFFVSMFLSWVFAYDADRALYVAAHRLLEADPLAHAFLESSPTAAADPGKDFGGRWSNVAFQARQKLALVFLPVVLLIVQQEAVLLIPESVQNEWSWQLSIAGVVGVAAVLLGLPWMVRLALGLKPLPPGPIRDRLTAAARRLRFRCSDVLLWDTRGGMANAMVIGVLPWPRYVIFTDRFLEEFNGDEVEAVFGHEVGHVKHRHMALYFAFLMLSMGVLFYACAALSPWVPDLGGGALAVSALDGFPGERRLAAGRGGRVPRLRPRRLRLLVAAAANARRTCTAAGPFPAAAPTAPATNTAPSCRRAAAACAPRACASSFTPWRRSPRSTA